MEITTFVLGDDVPEGTVPYAVLEAGEPAGIKPRGAPLSPAVRAEAEKTFGVTVLQGYGCTESSAVISAETIPDTVPAASASRFRTPRWQSSTARETRCRRARTARSAYAARG